jgi:hypothetical protein
MQIFDQPFAALRESLLLLFGLKKLARVAHRDRPGEAVRMLDLVELALDRLAQFHLIDVAQNEQRFNDLAERFERPVQCVLLRVEIEAAENLRGGCLFE